MPQQSLLTEFPAMTALDITVRSFPHTPFADQLDLTVAVGCGGRHPTSCWSARLQDLERDYLNTMVEDAVTTYMYGEQRKDITRALAATHKLARRHQATYGF